MTDFMAVLDLVAFFHGFQELGGAPGTRQGLLVISVVAHEGLVVQRLVDVSFHAWDGTSPAVGRSWARPKYWERLVVPSS